MKTNTKPNAASAALNSDPNQITPQRIDLPGTAPDVTVVIASPPDNAILLSQTLSMPVSLSGTALVTDSEDGSTFAPDDMSIRLGSAVWQPVTLSSTPDANGRYPWSFSGMAPATTTSLNVTVKAEVHWIDNNLNERIATGSDNVTLLPDTTPPALAIVPPANPYPVSVPIGSQADIPIAGASNDSNGTGVNLVQMKVDSGAFATVTPQAPNDWSSWSAHAKFTIGSNITNGQQNTLTFKAQDKAGNWTQSPLPTLTVNLIDWPPDAQLTLVNGRSPIFSPNPPVYRVTVTETAQGATLTVTGNASGHGVGVASLTWSVEGGASGTATLQATNDPTFSTWSASAIPIPFGDSRNVTFTCQNQNGTRSTVLLTVTLELSYTSPDSDSLSSLSYLYDLLHFAREVPRITLSGQTPVPGQTPNASDLIGEFHQPFDDLAVLANKPIGSGPVRQIRLCVEALRGYLSPGVTPAPDYLKTAYTLLLNQIGTSYEEIRLARTYMPVPPQTIHPARQALADRLGLDLTAPQPDALDALLLDPDAPSNQPKAITETTLEQLFGLQDTTRDVLSVGAKLGDTSKQITRWNLQGVEWGRNTASNGFIYASLKKLSASAFQVSLYRDAGRTSLVALGQITQATGSVSLQQQNNSGLSGNFTIAYTADNTAISLAAVPAFLSGQLAHLRTLWKNEDYPTAAPAGATPRIDPDLLQSDDFRIHVSTDPAYNLYTTRAGTVQGWFNTLKQSREGASTVPIGLNAILQSVLGKSSADLLAMDQQQKSGADITSQLAALNLARDAFSYLVRISTLVQNSQAVLSTEWSDVYSILVQVQKRRAFATWCDAERAANVLLGPDYFQISSSPVTLNPWRATYAARQAWQNALQARIDQQQALVQASQAAVDATEQATLPLLRDTLVTATAKNADQLTGQLLIDVNGSSYQMTTRIGQAIETLQSLFLALQNEPNHTFTTGKTWTLAGDAGVFNQEWEWIGSYTGWQAAMRIFLWPENLLQPGLRPDATSAFRSMVTRLRNIASLTPDAARAEAAHYLSDVGPQPGLPATLTENLNQAGLLALQTQIRNVFLPYTDGQTPPHYQSAPPMYLQEAYFFVPLHLALQLQQAGQFEAALAWLRTLYAYTLPKTAERRIYYGLVVEASTQTLYQRTPHWLIESLDPHDIATRTRASAYTCYTLMTILRALLDHADVEFSSDTSESVARARTLYLTAQDLYTPLGALLPSAPGVQANPLPPILKQHAAVNLAKIRRGRNIAGMLRQLQTFQANALAIEGMVLVQPTPYRYTTLIERAKQLIALTQQLESSYLAALEKTDAEAYNILKARQDLGLTQATVKLQDLRAVEAQDGIALASLQQQKSQLQVDHYSDLIEGDLSQLEKQSLFLQETELGLQVAAGGLYATSGMLQAFGIESIFDMGGTAASSFAQSLSSFAAAAGTGSAIASTLASYERRKEGWEFEQALAQRDVLIGQQQVLTARDHQNVAQQEQVIAQIQADHAQAVVDFLANKFTNVELYEWMSGILGRVYSYFLQQATATARLAQDQLAFERQEKSMAVIQADYWRTPSESGTGDGANPTVDRRGLTGSARLLQDIYQLDQYAFETNKRKLQLTKTISLARLAPFEFQRFRETGVLPFGTPMQLFDQDFPGHLLRLIRRVRTSVVALIPPAQGIHATLSTTGVSRVTIGDSASGFQDVVVRHDPELVALSSPQNASGLFEMDVQSELMLPFEGMGVDAAWEFQMPKAANRFDYKTIADVLITIEYTALHNYDYRQQVIRQLNRKAGGDRSFSFRQEFADAWYDLHNPDQTATPMTVQFTTLSQDFPPNIDDLAIAHVVLYVAQGGGQPFNLPLTVTLNFRAEGASLAIGGAASSSSGLFSTRSGSAANWGQFIGKKPAGTWTLILPNDQTTRDYFKNGDIQDILFVITYSGQTPEWPA